LSDEDDEPFLVVNGDVFTDYCFENLPELADNILAHLWLVANPEHNVKGDFILEEGLVGNQMPNQNKLTYTFSGIALYHANFFNSLKHSSYDEVLALGPLLRKKAEQRKVSGSLLTCHWTDVGTPERLAELNNNYKRQNEG
jgi:MurNAc alpha-1-phosphate uridylyltransferase